MIYIVIIIFLVCFYFSTYINSWLSCPFVCSFVHSFQQRYPNEAKNPHQTMKRGWGLRRRFGLVLPRLQLHVMFGALLICHAVYSLIAADPLNYETGICYDSPKSFRSTWVQTRTELFIVRWRSHKLRNAALYICISTRNVPVLRYITYHLLICPDVIYDTRYDILFDVPEVCITHGCLKRFGSSHHIYAEFVIKTHAHVSSMNITPPLPTPGGKIAVLLEPRPHPLYEYTVKQVLATLGPGWALQLLVSSENEKLVRQLFDVRKGGLGENIIITSLTSFGLDAMSRLGNRVQSAFSAHEVLYNTIPSEHIFWFQIDVLLRDSPHSNWLKHAYVGSEWHGCEFPTCEEANCAAVCGGGNSGLSLRRKSKLLLVASRGILPDDLWGVEQQRRVKWDSRSANFASDDLHDNSEDGWFEDDLQISFKLKKLGQLPPGDIPPRFAISQALPNGNICRISPVGMHKPWMTPWIDPRVIIWLLEAPFNSALKHTA